MLNLSWQTILKNQDSREFNFTVSNFGDLPKPGPITGKLEVRLLGCQDLLENVPDRKKRDSFTIAGGPERTPKSFKSYSVNGTSKSYTIKCNEISSIHNYFIHYLNINHKVYTITFIFFLKLCFI